MMTGYSVRIIRRKGFLVTLGACDRLWHLSVALPYLPYKILYSNNYSSYVLHFYVEKSFFISYRLHVMLATE